jgi:IMP dehydrogenase
MIVDGDLPLSLSYDDVLLVPQRSPIASRADVSTRASFTRRITLSAPVVSANMDTVTEAPMAIAMARAGGIGVIHRFLPIADQVREVARVKRAEALVIDDPFTVGPDLTLDEALEVMRSHGASGLVVIDGDRTPVGIITRRDTLLRTDGTVSVASVMTPQERLIVAPVGVDEDTAATMLRDARIEKLPLVDDHGRLAGLITIRDLLQRKQRPDATKDGRGRLAVAAAIGVRGDHLERAKALVDAGADALVLDIAHGHMEQALAAIGEVREWVGETEIVAGNVATPEGAHDLIAAGADAVKVGVGPGSVCSTRVVAGVGVPQFTAVAECATACHDSGIPVIADGGIRAGGDVAKAIGAGADTVMVGNLLAGCTESPGMVVSRGGTRVKVFRGMASAGAAAARRAVDGDAREILAREDQTEFSPIVPEGVEAVVPLRGDAADVVAELVGGLRSGMSYSNAATIADMQTQARFVRITTAGLKESHPHDVSF